MSTLQRVLESVSKKTDDIFVLILDDIEIPFKLPSIKIARQFNVLLENTTDNCERIIIYEYIFKLYCQDSYMAMEDPNIKAGIPETVAKLILYLSGTTENSSYNNSVLNFNRHKINLNLKEDYMKRVICRTFASYKFQDIEELNYQEFVNLFCQAEQVLLESNIIESYFDFSPKQTKETNSISQMIKEDQVSYRNFEQDTNPNASHQRNAKIRQQAIDKAKKEEADFRNKHFK